MKKILFIVFLFTLFTSCFGPDVRFIKPQPEHLDELTSIPAKFQGSFIMQKDTIEVTEYTINQDSINSEKLIVKGWGNYLFVNVLEDSLYKFSCGELVSVYNNEKLSVKYFSSSNWNIEDEKDFKKHFLFKNQSFSDIDTVNLGPAILDNVSVNQFQYLLNNAESIEIIRMKK